ncbi:hypothetical protein [Bartonella sp. DGB1]|uniref:hypothetical protein n=1 Tax=Bartonella sp. DGB1 TaxID=3239807 RepID=UPI003524A75A
MSKLRYYFKYSIYLILIITISTPSLQAKQQNVTTLSLNASITDNNDFLKDNVNWFLFTNNENKPKLIFQKKGGSEVLTIPKGDYILVTLYGYAKDISYLNITNDNYKKNINLNAGILSLSPYFKDKKNIKKQELKDFSFSISLINEEQDSEIVVIDKILPETPIIIKQGFYNITTYYRGEIAAKNELNIVAGKYTQADVKLDSAQITVSLANSESGEALAGTSWSIITETNDLVYEKTSSYISPMLIAGTYTVMAKYDGELYQKNIMVKSGEHKNVTLITSIDKVQ